MNDLKALGELIYDARKRRGLSAKRLSKITGISDAHIRRIEKGLVKKISPNFLRELSRTLGLPYEQLMVYAGYVDDVDKIIMDDRLQQTFMMSDKDIEQVNAFIAFLKGKEDGEQIQKAQR
jgi:transcriptional regulator with XRE-family HTH domain